TSTERAGSSRRLVMASIGGRRPRVITQYNTGGSGTARCPATAGGRVSGKNHAFCPRRRWVGQDSRIQRLWTRLAGHVQMQRRARVGMRQGNGLIQLDAEPRLGRWNYMALLPADRLA